MCTSNRSQACLLSRAGSKRTLPLTRSRDNVFVSFSHSYDKTSRLCVETKRCWTLAEDLLSEWEERKKSRAGGGAPCESRKIVLCALLLWQAIPVTIRLQRGCWATSGRRRSRRALQVCVSCTCCSCCVWHRYMSHRDKIVDVTVGRSIACFASEQRRL